MLAHGLPLPAFPRLEVASSEDGLRLLGLSGLIVKRTEFDAEIVAQRDQAGVLFEQPEAFGGSLAEPLPELVAFKEQAGVLGRTPAGALVGGSGFGRVFCDIEKNNLSLP